MTTTIAEVDGPRIAQGFAALGVDDALALTLGELGYEEPTQIQREAIPVLLAGKDLLGQAPTGTGKTAAFALPILAQLAGRDAPDRGTVAALVLVPTRELAMQVAGAVHRYGRSMGATVLPIYGGQAMSQQLRALRRGVDVVVATPGRVLDHIRRKSVDFSRLRTVVLDEADEMLDMGFAEDLEGILGVLPAERQTALFSATMAPRVAEIARRHLRDPERITIAGERPVEGEPGRVREVAYVVARAQKVEALGRVLDMESPASAIVFCRTRTEVDELAEVLGARGYGADALHGAMSQEQRDRVMRRFREGLSELLIATDVAARGLDIGHLSHVVNYDIPTSTDAYVHRVGRTGRAGREGVAITLLEPREQRLLRSIERVVRRRIAIETVPTVSDLRAKQMESTSASLREVLESGDFAEFCVIAEALASDFPILDIAAAAIKLAHAASTSPGTDVEIEPVAAAKPEGRGGRGERDRERPRTRDRGGRTERSERPSRDVRPERVARGTKAAPRAGRGARQAGGDFTRIYVPLGKRAGVRPKDLVGAIANEAQIDPQHIGAIEIADAFSLVEIQERDANAIISALSKTTIRGKSVKVRRERY